ncbi:RagB/SusD family nutrient uptake outer membrane protein [Bacteroidota bacterium]
MKNQVYNIILILFILIISGCEDFLDEKPVAEETIDSFLNDPSIPLEDRFENMMNAAYSVYYISERSWQNNKHYFENMIPNFLSDDHQKGGDGDSDFPEMLDMCLWSHITTNTTGSHYTTPWLVGYLGVSRANLILGLLEDNKDRLDSKVYDKSKGECLFIRGYFYFLLAKTYGGVPYFEETVLPENYFDQPRLSTEELYQKITDDFTEAISLLPEKSGLDIQNWGGRATKGAARAILARVHTMEVAFKFNGRSWNDVYNLTKAIKNSGEYSLLDNFAEVFESEGEMGSESVFEIPCADLGGVYGSSGGYMEGRMITPRVQTGLTYGNNYQQAAGWGFSTPTQDLFNEFDPGDFRRECSMIANGDIYLGEVTPIVVDAQCPSGYWQRKYAGKVVRNNTSGAENWRIVRYAEVLLTHAEAAYHISEFGEAFSALNEVHERAMNSTGPKGSVLGVGSIMDGIPFTYPTETSTLAALDPALNGEALLNAIKHERRVELVSEGIRFYDLVRWDEYEDAIKRKIPEDYFLKNNDPEQVIDNYRSHLLDGKVPVMPIPVDEVETFGIEQNPGY